MTERLALQPTLLPFRIPTPMDVVRGAFDTVEWTVETARLVSTLPARVVILLDGVDQLLLRVADVIEAAARAVGAVDIVVQAAAQSVAHVDLTVAAADRAIGRVNGVVDGAELLVGRAVPLLAFGEDVVGRVRPAVEQVLLAEGADPQQAALVGQRLVELARFGDEMARKLQPLAETVVESIDPHEVQAIVELIDQLPALTASIRDDVLPVLNSMDTVAPEVHQILGVAQDCLEALAGIPGFSFLRKRGGEKVEETSGPSALAEKSGSDQAGSDDAGSNQG